MVHAVQFSCNKVQVVGGCDEAWSGNTIHSALGKHTSWHPINKIPQTLLHQNTMYSCPLLGLIINPASEKPCLRKAWVKPLISHFSTKGLFWHTQTRTRGRVAVVARSLDVWPVTHARQVTYTPRYTHTCSHTHPHSTKLSPSAEIQTQTRTTSTHPNPCMLMHNSAKVCKRACLWGSVPRMYVP
jgi:hypothetical protein